MRRSWITALAAAPLLALPLLPAEAASAAPPVHGSGQVTCPIKTGSGWLYPGLTPAGSTNVVKIGFSGTFGNSCISAVTQPPGDQVTGGTFTGGGYYTGPSADSCANFDGADVVGRITVTMHWRTTGAPIQATTITYKNNPGTVSGSTTDTMTLNAPPGTAMKSGSFNSATTPRLTQLVTDLPGPSCGPGPFSTFNIVGGKVKV